MDHRTLIIIILIFVGIPLVAWHGREVIRRTKRNQSAPAAFEDTELE
jgi:hypothetical protein